MSSTMKEALKEIECVGSELMNQPVVKIYVLKSVMNKMIKHSIIFPKNLTDEYKNIPGSSNFKNKVYKSMKKHNKKNEDLKELIILKYNEYKYVGDAKTARVMTSNGELLSHNDIVEFMGEKHKGKAFCWNHHTKELIWSDTEHIKPQFKLFKKMKKNGIIKCMEYNNVEHEFNGQMWYSLVIQDVIDEKNPIDVGAFAIFRYMVSGWAYHFVKKENRDAMFAYLNK